MFVNDKLAGKLPYSFLCCTLALRSASIFTSEYALMYNHSLKCNTYCLQSHILLQHVYIVVVIVVHISCTPDLPFLYYCCWFTLS